MDVKVEELEQPLWKPRVLTIEFDEEKEFRIFSRIMGSDVDIANIMHNWGYNRDCTQNVLDAIAVVIRKEF